MAKAKKPQEPKQPQEQQPLTKVGAHIENVNITNSSAANEHTRAAVEALAGAATANANAIAEIARALKGAPATIERGICLSNISAD